jgi:FKBP-type peptidyl-prolyl cis-trans isomerase FklB
MNIQKMVFSSFIVLSLTFCSDGKNAELKDQKDKESYSLGYRFGENMQFQGAQLNLDVYLSGVRDALDGKKSRMTPDEIRSTIAGLQQRLAAAQQKTQKEQAEKNLSVGAAFLAENQKKEGVRTLPSGLQYLVLAEGTGKTPKKGDNVTVHYRGTLINGTEFESAYGRPVAPTFQVEGLIPGWSEALLMMKEGAKWRLFIPPNLAYGEKGSPPVIPANSTLIFEVELISVQ